MNWLKWLECWWHKKHIPMYYLGKDGKRRRMCARCGMEMGA